MFLLVVLFLLDLPTCSAVVRTTNILLGFYTLRIRYWLPGDAGNHQILTFVRPDFVFQLYTLFTRSHFVLRVFSFHFPLWTAGETHLRRLAVPGSRGDGLHQPDAEVTGRTQQPGSATSPTFNSDVTFCAVLCVFLVRNGSDASLSCMNMAAWASPWMNWYERQWHKALW